MSANLDPAALIQSAIHRTAHFKSSLDFLERQLTSDPSYQQNFLTCVQRLHQACLFSARASQKSPTKIHFVAVGKSAGVCKVVQSMFKSIGINAGFLYPTEAFHGDLGIVQEEDTVFLVSNGGQTKELLDLIPFFKKRNCYLIGITSKAQSALAESVDTCLLISDLGESCPLGQAPITSTVTTLALCQLLVAASMESRMLNLEDYAKNHPGGSIGRRIFLKVEDVMIKGNRLPFIGPDTDFKGCVVEMTRHALGVLIVNSPCTPGGFGIISEKDLRVGMEKFGPLVFEVTAKDLMNPNPIVVESHILALEALEFMRSRGKPLLFLPVVHPKETSANSAQECIGLLRVHELVSQGIAMT